MASWSEAPRKVEAEPIRRQVAAAATERERASYYLTAIPGSSDYVLHTPYDTHYRLSTREAMRLQVAGIRFEARP